MIFSYGAPELQIMNVAIADLAHHYELPLFCIAGATDSKVVDAQAGAEMAFSLLVSALNGCNLIHDVGYLESGLCSSNESIVLADEIVGYVKRLLAMYPVNSDTLALDVIDQVGPKGGFLEHDHTLSRFRETAWWPNVFNRQSYESWNEAGAESISNPLRKRAASILKDHSNGALSLRQIEVMDVILQRRSPGT
jgi:trimethylamine--corrinoid protein Co-methyltransferase